MKINGYPLQHKCSLGEPLYVHGTLSNHEMIVGIDNPSQILNPEFAANPMIRDSLIKSQILNLGGQNLSY